MGRSKLASKFSPDWYRKWPNWRRRIATPGAVFGFRSLRSVDFAHGVVKGETQDLDKEVDGVAGEVSLGPAPVAFLDDETGIDGKFEVPRLPCDELEFAFFQERHQWSDARGADLLVRTRRAGARLSQFRG